MQQYTDDDRVQSADWERMKDHDIYASLKLNTAPPSEITGYLWQRIVTYVCDNEPIPDTVRFLSSSDRLVSNF